MDLIADNYHNHYCVFNKTSLLFCISFIRELLESYSQCQTAAEVISAQQKWLESSTTSDHQHQESNTHRHNVVISSYTKIAYHTIIVISFFELKCSNSHVTLVDYPSSGSEISSSDDIDESNERSCSSDGGQLEDPSCVGLVYLSP